MRYEEHLSLVGRMGKRDSSIRRKATTLRSLRHPRLFGLSQFAGYPRAYRCLQSRGLRPDRQRHHHDQQARIEISRHAGQDPPERFREVPEHDADDDRSDQERGQLLSPDHGQPDAQRQERHNQRDIERDLDVGGHRGDLLEYRVHQPRIQPTHADVAANRLRDLTRLPPVGLQLQQRPEEPEAREDVAQVLP